MLAERAFQRVARIGREAEAEAPIRLAIEAPPLEIGARRRPARRGELGLEELGRRRHRAGKRGAALLALALLRCLARHFEAGDTRQLLHRFAKTEILRLHGEADDVAMGPTAEAVIEALFLDDVERRRLFLMERAQAGIFAPTLLQRDAPAHDLRQADAGAQLVQETGGIWHWR